MERYLCTRIKTWKLVYFKVKHAIFVNIVIIGLTILLNSHVLVLTNFKNTNNTGVTGACSASDSFKLWRPVCVSITHYKIFECILIILIIIGSYIFVLGDTLHSIGNHQFYIGKKCSEKQKQNWLNKYGGKEKIKRNGIDNNCSYHIVYRSNRSTGICW